MNSRGQYCILSLLQSPPFFQDEINSQIIASRRKATTTPCPNQHKGWLHTSPFPPPPPGIDLQGIAF